MNKSYVIFFVSCLIVFLLAVGVAYWTSLGHTEFKFLTAVVDTRFLKEAVNFVSNTEPQPEVIDQNVIVSTDTVAEPLSDFPVYPGGELIESSQRVISLKTNQDLRAKWKVEGAVPEIMQWYLKAIVAEGWKIDMPPNDPSAKAEQVANISKGNLSGYVAVEDEAGTIEVMIDFKEL